MVGNLPNFTKIDILRCLLRIEKPVSRSYLKKSLGLGEGTVKSILLILKQKGLIKSGNKGHSLSKKGSFIISKIRGIIETKKIGQIGILPDKKIIALQIKNQKDIGKAYVLRDVAVKNGADGALILKYDKRLILCDSDYNAKLGNLESEFKLKKNYYIIMAYASSYKLAEHGALATAAYLNNYLKSILRSFR
jgi:hypothetical protein